MDREDDWRLPPSGYIRLERVLRIIPVGKSTWWLGVKEGRFPQAVKLGPRTTAWRVEDIRKLMEAFDRGEFAAERPRFKKGKRR